MKKKILIQFAVVLFLMFSVKSSFAQNIYNDYKPFVLQGIDFANNSDKLFASSYQTLDKIVVLLNNDKKVRLLIGCHSDNVGSGASNLALTEKRALTIKNYLISKGIGEERIKAEGFGSTKPIALNDNAEGRHKNKRVEIQYIK